MNKVVANLKENEQDFEWYPTTKEIINCVKSHLGDNFNSILDIGAGDGRVLKELAFIKDERGSYFEKMYSIEKSEILRSRQDKDIIPLGCDFWQNTLIDKEVDVVFCNPPYSEYEEWCEKIIKEANTKHLYLVIPQRHKDSDAIKRALQARDIKNHDIIGSFDFLTADRSARAKVDVVYIKMRSRYKDECKGAFELFLDENFPFSVAKGNNYDAQKEKINNYLVNAKNQIEALVELYNAELNKLMDNFKAICTLDADVLEEIGFKKSVLSESISKRIEGLKNIYWNELFERYEPITSKFTNSYKNNILEELSCRKNIDFNLDNVYALTIWFLKNASNDFSEQVLDFYMTLAEKENLKAYKSNRHFTTDTWRYMRNDERKELFKKDVNQKSKLDYRLVFQRGAFYSVDWGGKGYFTEHGINMINDFLIIARNLGFAINSGQFIKGWYRDVSICPGEKNYLYFNGDETLLEYKVFKNGNMHVKLHQDLIKAINIEAGRLLGWLRSPQEASEELEISESEVNKYFNLIAPLSINDNMKLLAC
ncbi:hypothetical protein ACHJH3_06930 [Campylobacter sp. MOP7]|uniref:class I SAM-dependent methyltransferase n=1 Tax=Campylobacter canis TaxID=3378588 RepID=UPI00387E2EF4